MTMVDDDMTGASTEQPSRRVVPGFARPHSVVSMSQTSMPRWDVRMPELPAAASFVVIAFTDLTTDVVALLDGTGVPVSVIREESAWSDDFAERIARMLETQRVGVRFVLVGPEQHIMRAESVLQSLDTVGEEIVMHCTDTTSEYLPAEGQRRIFCGHCHEVLARTAAIGDNVTCTNCGASLTVHYHYSRRQSAYLGVPDGQDLAE